MTDSPDIVLERSLYYGVVVMAMLFGVQAFMFFQAASLLCPLKERVESARCIKWAYVVISAALLVLIAIGDVANVVFMEFMWIEHRDVDGGPLGYLQENSSVWWQTTGTLAVQTANALGDGLLIYRTFIIWAGSWGAIALPILFYLGSIAMALIATVQSALPHAQFFQGKAVTFGVPWIALSVALNLTCTGLIMYRLIRARMRLQTITNLPLSALNMYTGASAVLVESALPFSVVGVVCAVTYGRNMDIAPAFTFIWGSFCALAPQFIIFRVATGRAWTQTIAAQISMNTITSADLTISQCATESPPVDLPTFARAALSSSGTFADEATHLPEPKREDEERALGVAY